MRPFIIDWEITDKIKNLVAYAEKNPFTMGDLLDSINKQLAPAGDMEQYVLVLPFGYRIVYSIEKQVIGDVRHFSISVDADGKLPNVIAIKEVMRIIGFEKEFEECIVKVEQLNPKRQAVNVWEVKKRLLKI